MEEAPIQRPTSRHEARSSDAATARRVGPRSERTLGRGSGEQERLQRIRRIMTESPERLRNVCVTGHIDHGKTTLTDSLLISNGFLSQRLVGKARYLDYREDEQSRGITMKSAGVTLYHVYRGAANTEIASNEYVITLLDSPGHVDFAAEVSAATRLSDGSLIVVDVVEGICSQTRAVLRQAMSEGLRPILVLNKIDRLFLELQLDADEACVRLRRVLEDANAVLGAYLAEQRLRLEEQTILCRHDTGRPLQGAAAQEPDGAANLPAPDTTPTGSSPNEEESLFEPARGNVVFASALDGWAFRLRDFVSFVATRFGIRREVLEQTLWGDYHIQAKTKRVTPIRDTAFTHGRPPRTMFVQFVLEPFAHIYRSMRASSLDEDGRTQRQRLVDRLGILVPERDLFHRDTRYALQSVLSRWLPLSRTILDAVVDQIPAAPVANRLRLEQLWPHDPKQSAWAQALANAMAHGDISDAAPIMICVGKVMSVDDSLVSALRSTRSAASPVDQERIPSIASNVVDAQRQTTDDSGLQLALGRILCGALDASTTFEELFVYGPRYRADDPTTHVEPFCMRLTHGHLEAFILNGRDVIPIGETDETASRRRLSPGAVVALRGVGASILKTATISSLPPGRCLQFASLSRHGHGRPVVFVALEPAERLADLARLRHGLRLLNQADPAVETWVSESGELVLGVSGELHLQRCLRDLEERFAGVPVKCSAPMTALRETVAGGVSTSPANPWVTEQQRRAETWTDHSGGAHVGVGGAASIAELGEHLGNTSLSDEDRNVHVGSLQSNGVEDTALETWSSWSGPREDQRRALHGGGVVPVPLPAYAVTLYIYAAPLPHAFVEALESASRSALRALYLRPTGMRQGQASPGLTTASELVVRLHRAVMEDASHNDAGSSAHSEYEMMSRRTDAEAVKDDLQLLFQCLANYAVAMGPHDLGSNVLLASEGSVVDQLDQNAHARPMIERQSSDWVADSTGSDSLDSEHGTESQHWYRIRDAFRRIWGHAFENHRMIDLETLPAAVFRALVSAFQVVSAAGPLAEEPMQGVCFVVHAMEDRRALNAALAERVQTTTTTTASTAPHAGALISLLTEALRRAVLAANPRLAEPMFHAEIQCSSNALGRVHTVLGAARAHVISEQIKEYHVTSTFLIRALVPASSTFGFADKIRRASSGAASEVELQFLGAWQVLEQDPFWSPATTEELELLGTEDTTATSNNLARVLMEQIRARKGQRVAFKLVERAEKQRTLARKK
ncbi:hypothetical protein CCYA_CCYA11G3156 [Cyanidiococcus yangmingshanensis]|nr:hypothetical protein CCYA_CCYA11G3156 [Cyanidiococcus yangmingshanensis]